MEENLVKKVLLIDNLIECNIFLRKHARSEGNVVIVCDNAEAQAMLLKKCIPFRTTFDFLTNEELDEITQLSIQYMDHWYHYKDFSKYRTFDLGSLFSLDFGFMEKIVLYIEKIIKIVEKEHPRVLVVPDSYRSLTEDVIMACRLKDVTCQGYQLNSFDTIKSWLQNNAYYRYLTRSVKFRILLNEIRDYISPIPREFKVKGRGAGRVKNGTIVVTAMSRNEVITLAAPLRELEKRGFTSLIFVMDCDGGGVLKRLEAEGFRNYIRPGDLFNRHYRNLYEEIRMNIENRWHAISNDSGFSDSLLHKGVPVLRHASPEKMTWMVTKLFPYWAVIFEMFYDLIRNSSAKAAIAMNNPINLGRAAAAAGNEAFIPTIDIQHGSLGSIAERFTVTKFCIWSDFDKNLLAGQGISGDKLVVTGNPAFDFIIARKFDENAIRQKNRISGAYKSIILWAPSAEWVYCYSGENYNERMFRSLQEVAARHRNILFVFKPHPSERVKRFRKILDKSLANLTIVDPDQGIDELVYISDIVMSWNSSVIVEAAILDKPIIGMNFFGRSEKIRCVSEGIAIEAKSIEELENAIRDITLNNEDVTSSMKRARATYIEKFLYKLDGLAAGRIVDTLEDLIKNPPSKMASA